MFRKSLGRPRLSPHYRPSRPHVEMLETRRLLTAIPVQLAIANGNSSSPRNMIEVGDVAFFTANDGVHGRELWKTDGTAAGTAMVKEIIPGDGDSFAYPAAFANVNGTLFFTASDGIHGNELWKSDGTAAGTIMVKDITNDVYGFDSAPKLLTNVNGTLFFTANDGIHGRELWKSDGTEAGTVLVKDIQPGDAGSLESNGYPAVQLTNVNGTLFFSADDGANGRELWTSDGTTAGTVMVKDIAPGSDGYQGPYAYYGPFPRSSNPGQFSTFNGKLFFTADDQVHGRELWSSDGTAAGTVMVSDINAVAGSEPHELTNANGILFFNAADESHGRQLWKSDGTTAGTVMVKEIFAGGSQYNYPRSLTSVGGSVFFRADDGIHGIELWKSDGTAAGTALVADVRPDASTDWISMPSNLTNVGGTLYFTADDAVHGRQLWKSDGTTAGTSMVTSDSLSSIDNLVNVNGALFFGATERSAGNELWTSDGSQAGTRLVKDIDPRNTASSYPANFTDVNGVTFFTANGELWKSDGTQGGSVRVRPGLIFDQTPSLTNVNGTLFFRASDAVHGQELWKSDGTTAGTVMVKDSYPGSVGGGANQLTNVNGKLFFAGIDDVNGARLWVSDGTEAGTVPLLAPGFGGSGNGGMKSFTAVNDTLFFVTLCFDAESQSLGEELWKSDGTTAGTVLVKDIGPGPGSSHPSGLTNFNGKLYFNAADGDHGYELWESDGTEAGTVMVSDIGPRIIFFGSGSPAFLTNVNGTLFFAASDYYNGTELWKTDGTAGGTVMVKDIWPGVGGFFGGDSSSPQNLTNVNGTLFFSADDGIHGQELWKTDGTADGTQLVRDIVPGSNGGSISQMTSVGGTLYFVLDDGVHGRELWTSDGTSSGTKLFADIAPGNAGSSPSALTSLNGRLWLSANDGVNGTEPWLLRESSSIVGQHLFYNGSSRFDAVGGPRSPLPFSDDNAIAIDKSAYLPGSGPATFASVSSYSKGINGIMVDIAGPHGAITASDFIFQVGNDNSPDTWDTAAAPISVTVRAGAGEGGSDRVEIIWADNAIQQTWLQVIVKGYDNTGGGNTNTGLAASHTFYFASSIGDDGTEPDDGVAFRTSVTDELGARNHLAALASNLSITNIYDYNRDGKVDAIDQLIARNHPTTNQTAAQRINLGGVELTAPEAEPAAITGSGTADPGLTGEPGIACSLASATTPSVIAPVPKDAPPALLSAADSSAAVRAIADAALEQESPAYSFDDESLFETVELEEDLLSVLVGVTN